MANILESLTSMLKPEMIGAISKTFGVHTSAVQTAIGAAGPVMLGSMARTASHGGGAETLRRLLPTDGDGLFGSLGNIGNMLGGMMGAGSAGGATASVLGRGSNAIAATISRAAGFNVTPLLGMLAPAVMGIVGKAVQSGNLDGAGLTALLSKEQAEFRGNPANAPTMLLVDSAMAAGDQAAEMIARYGESWDRVAVAPAAVLYLVASADMSGPIGAVKEARAANDALVAAANASAPTSLLAAAFAGGITREQLASLKVIAPHKEKLLDAIRAAITAVRTHSPDEAQAFNDALFAVATATAHAAKEGGFLGLGGTLVSTDEQVALDTLKSVMA